MADSKFGCVIFDDQHSHTSGYAAKSSDPRSSRIASTANLDSDVTWITNLGFIVSGSSGFSSHSRFRRDDFLRRKIASIAESFGLTEKALTDGHPLLEKFILEHKIGDMVGVADYPSAMSLLISQIFNNTAELGTVLTGYDFNHISRYNLGLREVAHPLDQQLSSNAVDSLTNATSAWINCERNARAGIPKTMTFRLEPVGHALKILDVPMPFGKWHYETNDAKSIEIIKAGNKPFIAKVSMKNVNPEFNRLLNFGSRGGYSGGRGTKDNRRLSAREWLTDIELKMISGLADVKIKEIMYCDNVVDYDWMVEAKSIMHFLKDKLTLSYSGGLLAENMWTGVAAKYSRSNSRDAFNPITPFMYALDRYYCFMAAVQLTSEGFSVNGYGAGQVKVEYEDDSIDWDHVSEAAIRHGLIPPAGIVEKALTADLKTPLGIIQSLTATGDIGRIIDIDNKVIRAVTQKLTGTQ